MQATAILKEEHRVIERVLDSLEAAANSLRSGAPVSPAVFLQAADFIRGFADGCHHQKEEGVLFPALEASGIPAQGGPIGVMLFEHEEGRKLTGAMRAAAEKLQAGESRAAAEVVENALQYVALLRQHIAKEDNVLFPMADRAIQGRAQTELTEAFERVEHEETGQGVHERFLALADAIERAVAQ